MPRTTDRKPRYIASMKVWRKRYRGKAKTWAASKGKSDQTAQRRAFAGCLLWMAGLDQAQADEDNLALYGMTEATAAERVAKMDAKIEAGRMFGRNPNDTARIKELEAEIAAGASGKTLKKISAIIEEWLAVQLQRVERGELFPSAPRSQRLKRSTLGNYVQQTKYILAFAKEDKMPIDSSGLKAWLTRWRTYEETFLLAGKIKPSTFNSKMSAMRAILSWLEDTDYFESLPTPRIMSRLCEKYRVEPNAKSISIKNIRKLWAEADNRNRLYIVLGLNCALYGSDIAELKRKNLTKDGRLAGERPKTNAPFSIKLWPITRELIEEQREKGEGLLFKTRKGTPLVVERSTIEKGRVRNDSISIRFSRLAKRCKIKASFSMLRDTSATMIERRAKQWTDFHLAHKDIRMAAFYIDSSVADFTEYDAAIDAMEAELALPKCWVAAENA